MTTLKCIRTPDDLAQLLEHGEWQDFFIVLNGSLRSSKAIKLRPSGKSFYVLNEIDGSRQVLTPKSLYTRSNIGRAMKLGSFYAY